MCATAKKWLEKVCITAKKWLEKYDDRPESGVWFRELRVSKAAYLTYVKWHFGFSSPPEAPLPELCQPRLSLYITYILTTLTTLTFYISLIFLFLIQQQKKDTPLGGILFLLNR